MSRIPGVVSAIVKNLNDPDGQGRIELEFKHLPSGPKSSWAPVAAALAGGSRGAFLMPEIDDEVLVAFDQGDFNHPFIVGFLWNGVDKPPETNPKNRVILTPGGHTLRFEDGDPKKVILKSNSGHAITLDDSSGSQKVKIETKGSLSLTLDDSASSITISGGGRTVTIQGGTFQIT
jgi:uncharacterized protein involved in type VI secretion and phage assembly